MSRVQPVHLPLSSGESVVIGLVTAAVVLVPLLGVPAAHFSGMTREGVHALLAVILGVTVAEILLDRHSGGKTSIVGEGLRVVLVFLVGYLGPSLFGLGAAELISLGDPVTVLWLVVVLLVLVLFLLGQVVRPALGAFRDRGALCHPALRARQDRSDSRLRRGLAAPAVRCADGHRPRHPLRRHGQPAHPHPPALSRGLWWLLWLAGTVTALLIGGKLLVLG